MGRQLRLAVFLCAVVAALLFVPQAVAAVHTVRLRGHFLTEKDTERVGYRRDGRAEVSFVFEGVGGKSQDLRTICRQPGFSVRAAALRLSVTETEGKMRFLIWRALKEDFSAFAMRAQGGNWLVRGENLLDMTALFRSWLEEGEAGSGFLLSAVNAKKDHDVTIRRDFEIRVTFEAEGLEQDIPPEIIRETELVDSALSMLEKGNAFLARYDETVGSLTEAAYELGLPYYFAGRNEDKLGNRYNPQQESHYFRSEKRYLYGFDCVGFTQWAYAKEGLPEHPGIGDILKRWEAGFFLPRNDTRTWPFFLKTGDLLCVDHGYNHILIYLGTMRTLGFEEGEIPETEDILDCPLFIHCGTNPFYYERYRRYLRENGDQVTTPTDGGVTISVVMPDISLAPHAIEAPWGTVYGYYDVQGTPLLVFPLDDCTRIAWYGVGNEGEE